MKADRPNIILITTDQQRYDTIGALGFPHMQTPHLDRLAQEGVVFEQCYCTAPSCVPSRASFFNVRYPHTLKVYHNGCQWEHSWVEQLQAAGYHTVNVGKMHTVPMDAPCGFDQRFIVENKDRPLHLDRPHGNVYDEWDKFLNNNGVRKPSRETYRKESPLYETALGAFEWPLEERYHPDIFVGRMAQWLIEQRESKSPLFLKIGFPGPHPPYDPPRRFLHLYEDIALPVPDVSRAELAKQPPPHAAYRKEMMTQNHDSIRWHDLPSPELLLRLRRHYAANVTLIDEQIGQIMTALEQKGYLENAIVIFMSDHGDCLGDHGHIQKWTMYDVITRMPMLVWAPKQLPGGERVDALLQQMDIVPLVFELAGLPTPEGSTISALSVLRGEREGRKAVFAEHASDNILREVNFVTMVRTRDWKLVHYLDQPWGELYDLAKDPQEIDNLWEAPEYKEARQQLLEILRDWRIRESLIGVKSDGR